MPRKPSQKKEEKQTQSVMLDLRQPLPLLPLRDTLVLPGTSARILVERQISLNALRKASKSNGTLLLSMQKDSEKEIPESSDLFSVGVVARLIRVTEFENGFYKVLFEGLFAADLNDVTLLKKEGEPESFEATAAPREFYFDSSPAARESAKAVLELFHKYASLVDLPADLLDALDKSDMPLQIYFGIVPFLRLSLSQKQELLEMTSVKKISERVEGLLQSLIDVELLLRRSQADVQKKMQQSQRDFLISEQIRMLQGELSNADGSADIDILVEKLKAKNFDAKVQEKMDEEIARLRMMPPASPEFAQIRTYLDWFLSFPYNQFTETEMNLRRVQETLDARHFGLNKVKERILEYVSVLRLTNSSGRAPVLCLVGPPGVGKTTLAASVAQAVGREFVRVTLGGVRDEAEIRGHRRTYIGAMPGRFIQAIRRAKCMNPVILLDEIDKMSSDFRGDPGSALLELLDPEQNKDFTDHFMEVGFDFSKVLFIATANVEQNIPEALHDRLEVVRLPGYYKHEKISIAEKHLIPDIASRCGVREGVDFSLSKKQIEQIISEYTREAGVRELDRLLEKIVRVRAKEKVLLLDNKKSKKSKAQTPEVSDKEILTSLGVPRFTNNRLPAPGRAGRITGLAWTSVGGEILTIECMLLSGRGRLSLTGKLGEVMKESAQIAMSLVRAKLRKFGVDPELVKKTDIHIHVPEGAVPKDGPSAGIALTLALLSAFTKQPVLPTIAFTGEVSLSGDLLPIGGLNEKALAAQEAGVKTLHIPTGNQKDVVELPVPAKKALKIHTHDHIDEIIKILFKEKK